MSKDIDVLDSLDEYADEEYSAYLEYTQLKDQCVIEPTTLYINEKHEFCQSGHTLQTLMT